MGVNKARVAEIEKYLSKDNLEKYLKTYSANYIATKLFPDFKTTAGTVIDRAIKFGIKTHSMSESCFLSDVKSSKLNTIRAKYGVDNPSQATEIKQKKEEQAIKKYGVKNVFQSEEIKNKSKATMLEKYGVEYGGALGKKSDGKRSSFHKDIEKLLDKKDIEYQSEVTGKFIKYNEYKKTNYSPIVDILIESAKLVIECNGDFWHANPKLYKDNDTFDTWAGKKTAKQIWEHDHMRKIHIESFGYEVLVIWESEFNYNKQAVTKKVLDAIKNRIN